MKCRYCGATNVAGEERCVKCQRRMLSASQGLPVVQTAAVPETAPVEGTAAISRPQVVGGTGERAAARPTQKPLFAFREQEKVVSIPLDVPKPGSKGRPQGSSRSKPAPLVGQESFDFAPSAPSRPLSRELPRSEHHQVAPLGARAMAAVFDALFVITLCGVFAASVRITLGEWPISVGVLPYWLGAFAAVAVVYKLAWCLADRSSPGVNLSGLELVSFDGQRPSGTQRIWRMLSGWFSLAAAGMGLMWALGDQDRLTWHDHISQTFLTPWHRES